MTSGDTSHKKCGTRQVKATELDPSKRNSSFGKYLTEQN